MAPWNFTIDDTSPLLRYLPYADGSNSGLTNGWIPWYTDSGFLSQNGQAGSGASYHRTSLSGASVSLSFYGTGVDLFGISNSTYNVIVDGAPFQLKGRPDGMLASISNLTETTHNVTSTATPSNSSQQLAFDSAVIFTSFTRRQVTEAFYDNTFTERLEYSGTWNSATAPGIPNTTVTHPWEETKTLGSSVSLDFGPGAVGISLWGMANYGNWLYSVSVDGGQPNTYNGSTFWQVPDALLYYQGGLDPSKNHTVTLTNSATNMKLALNSMRVLSIQSSSSDDESSSKHSVNPGVIAGPIVAVVVLLLAGAFFWWWRRRNRSSSPSKQGTDMAMLQPDPYYDRPSPLPATHGHKSSTSATALSPASASVRSFPTTVLSAPPGVTVMSWGYDDERHTATDSETGTSRNGRQPLSEKPPPPPSPGPSDSLAVSPQRIVSPAVSESAPQTADIDHIIELIAQRIDQGRGNGNEHEASAPPEYRG